MIYHVVLVGRDGFTKEVEMEFEGSLPRSHRTRQYPYLSPPSLIESKEPTIELKVIDREFYHQGCFYALGKNIAYYKEY